jgi:hypothetical protein
MNNFLRMQLPHVNLRTDDCSGIFQESFIITMGRYNGLNAMEVIYSFSCKYFLKKVRIFRSTELKSICRIE